ncbi:hypothetical protein AB0L40_07420 [Patulibacter sp. NPDC049589]|uniref:hypothetical protein n=1 Tax=Patulibacter sp. NPDC049589 TaxID=3154731 RepID=UPI00342888E1
MLAPEPLASASESCPGDGTAEGNKGAASVAISDVTIKRKPVLATLRQGGSESTEKEALVLAVVGGRVVDASKTDVTPGGDGEPLSKMLVDRRPAAVAAGKTARGLVNNDAGATCEAVDDGAAPWILISLDSVNSPFESKATSCGDLMRAGFTDQQEAYQSDLVGTSDGDPDEGMTLVGYSEPDALAFVNASEEVDGSQRTVRVHTLVLRDGAWKILR